MANPYNDAAGNRSLKRLAAERAEQAARNETRRQALIFALHRWIAQRPGLEFGNYGDVSSYRSELRKITRDLNDARTLLAAIEWRSIGVDALALALRDAWSGRLTWDGERLDYCTGQYWPTEYRAAVCAGLALALRRYWRDDGNDAGKMARGEFGRGLASRWFA